MSAPAPPDRVSLPARPEIRSAAVEPARLSAPAAPVRVTARFASPVRPPRLALDPEAALTARVSVPPPAAPFTLQAWPVSWAPVKVAVVPSSSTTASMLEKAANDRSVEAVIRTVSTPLTPSTVSPAAASDAPA